MNNYFNKYLKYKNKYHKYLEYLLLENNQYGGKKKKMNIKHNNIIYNKKMSNIINYKEAVSEPWFSLISLGLKIVEGRKNKGRFKEMKVGDIIEWTNNDFGFRSVLTEIIGKEIYPTFQEYLETEGLQKCLPTIHNIEQGLSVYFTYYTKDDEKEYGVVAIRLKVL